MAYGGWSMEHDAQSISPEPYAISHQPSAIFARSLTDPRCVGGAGLRREHHELWKLVRMQIAEPRFDGCPAIARRLDHQLAFGLPFDRPLPSIGGQHRA